jgi:hypothetical protein
MRYLTNSAMRLTGLALGTACWLYVAPAAGEDSAVRTQTMSGKAYEGEHLSGARWPEPIYSVSLVTEKGPGLDRLRVVDTDPSGRQFSTQTVDFDGDSPKAYVFSNVASNQAGRLSVTPNELIIEFTEGGTTKTAREPRPPLFAVGPSIGRIVAGHLGEIIAGKSIAFRIVAPNRLETFGVEVTREPSRSDETIGQVKSGQWIRLRVGPDSAVGRLFAPKVSIVVDARTAQTLFVSGPLPSPEPGVGMLKQGTIRYDGKP